MILRCVSVGLLVLVCSWKVELPACAQGLSGERPAWQPYREVQPALVAVATRPAPMPMVAASSIDSISDAQLNQLRTVSGGDPFDPAYVQSPVLFGDPVSAPLAGAEVWGWQVLPEDLIWHSYWAGAHESRISGVSFNETNSDTSLLDATLGGRVGLVRYGTADSHGRPQGWQVDIEGAAFPRLNLDENWDLEAVDFRFGVPITYGMDNWQAKFSYYHLSAHLGDEQATRLGNLGSRINFSRDTLVFALSYYPRPAWRLYGEAGWAFYTDVTEPWEFQFGLDYAQPGPTGRFGTPFFAINGHLREEVDFGGNLVIQTGVLWRGKGDHVMRMGLHYFNGKSSQFQFFSQFEQQIGAGLWYDY